MELLIGSIVRKFEEVDKILIYGTGNYANIVYPILKKNDIKKKICAFVVTNLVDAGEIDGLPIMSLSDLEKSDFSNYGVLVAVGREYEQEILENLKNYNFFCVLKLTDFILSDDDFLKIFRKQSEVQFLEWIVNENVRNGINTIEQLKEIISNRRDLSVNSEEILYISGDLSPRTIKIIGALARKGKSVLVLLYGNAGKLMRHLLLFDNVKIYECINIFEVFYRAMICNPLVYYFEPVSEDRSAAEIMIRHKDLFGKIVFAAYDVLNDGYAFISEEQKKAEKYALENADGIVWRWFSKEFLAEEKGFKYQGKSIHFLDYCNGYQVKVKQNNSKLRLCFIAGGTYGLFDEVNHKGNFQYVQVAKMDTIMESIGNRSDCIFNVFIGTISEKDKSRIEELSRKYSNFKCFVGTKYDEMISMISEYDYGCYWSTGVKEMPQQEFDEHGLTGSNYMNAVPNRYFDYLDAGIPIIAVQPKKICDYLNKYGVLIKMNVTNFDIEYLMKNRHTFKKNVEKAKKELLIDNHIEKLIDFFDKL